MMKHLSPEEFVDALEGAVSPVADAHLRECEPCRAELADMRAIVDVARAAEASEPSPLFWDHFSARVKDATQQEPSRAPWFSVFGWRPVAALAVAASALAIAMYVRPANAPVPDGDTTGGFIAATTPSIDEDGSWNLVMALASELEWSDVSQAAAPVEGTADAMIEDLTPDQREALARLLEKGIGDL
jgi:hypothetical protein